MYKNFKNIKTFLGYYLCISHRLFFRRKVKEYGASRYIKCLSFQILLFTIYYNTAQIFMPENIQLLKLESPGEFYTILTGVIFIVNSILSSNKLPESIKEMVNGEYVYRVSTRMVNSLLITAFTVNAACLIAIHCINIAKHKAHIISWKIRH